jgi:hypothetical protein
MLEFLASVIIDTGLQTVGWGVIKVLSLGRYRGFQPENVALEATVGFITLCAAGYGAYRLLF